MCSPTDTSLPCTMECLRDPVWGSPPPPPSPFPLLQLPAELVLDILDYLPDADLFHVGQTCRPLRAAVDKDWESTIDKAPFAERTAFFHDLADNKPDHWACVGCHKLHKVDTEDTPANPQDGCDFSGGRMMRSANYHIQQKHVQLAMKYHRTGHNLEYLEKLVTPFEQRFKVTGMEVRYVATPRIVQGHFILHEEWIYTSTVDQTSWDAQETAFQDVQLCPHIYFPDVETPYAEQDAFAHYTLDTGFQFAYHLDAAFRDPGTVMQVSCECCATDYTIEVEGQKTTFNVYHDFTDGNPLDTAWGLEKVWERLDEAKENEKENENGNENENEESSETAEDTEGDEEEIVTELGVGGHIPGAAHYLFYC